jgi:hypothetical protein
MAGIEGVFAEDYRKVVAERPGLRSPGSGARAEGVINGTA